MAIQNRDVMDCVSDATERILALIAEAMLSDDVLDQAGRSGRGVTLTEWRSMNAEQRSRVRRAGQWFVVAALAAAGVTGAGQEGGEGE